jgi:predicted amidohydrolase
VSPEAPSIRMAAVQLEPVLGDVAANLERCERLADAAAAAGAQWIVLPEFFSTGTAFREDLAGAAVAPDGAATELLCDLARRHGATVGGSFLCRDLDGEVRNAFLLSDPDGRILGRHDKDLPTMWENCLYVGGEDDGIIEAGALRVGAAMCWELMRTQTARRLRGQVDLVVGGSLWLSIPPWPPRTVFRRLEASNAHAAAVVAERFARFVGAPVVHAAHCGPLECRIPWTPFHYRGIVQGGALIADADGRVLARRDRREGPGHAIADVQPGRVPALDPLPRRFWLHRRGAVPTFMWHYQREHGRRWYARHTRGLPPLDVPRGAREALRG